MIGAGLILFAVIGFFGALIKKWNPEKVKEIKKEDANKILIMSVFVFALGLWMRSGPSYGEAVTNVLATIPNSSTAVNNYETGEFADGIAVVINKTAGYWVKDGKVFAVNGIAEAFSPGVEYAPADVTWNKIEAVVN